MNLFDHLNNITLHKKEFDDNNQEVKTSYLPFLINRFISMTEVYIPIVNEINKYPDVPKATHYRYYKQIIPKRKQFFPYIKKPKDFNIEEKECICEYFECSLKDADRYIDTLSEEQIKRIIRIYNR